MAGEGARERTGEHAAPLRHPESLQAMSDRQDAESGPQGPGDTPDRALLEQHPQLREPQELRISRGR